VCTYKCDRYDITRVLTYEVVNTMDDNEDRYVFLKRVLSSSHRRVSTEAELYRPLPDFSGRTRMR